MPHICMDEILMFMAMLPFIGVFFRKIHAWWHAKFSHKEHKKSEPVVRVIDVGPMRDVIDIINNPPKFRPPPVNFESPYQQGLSAFDRGDSIGSNPHEIGSDEYYNWLSGWHNASSDEGKP